MRIESIVIENYRQYAGRHDIVLANSRVAKGEDIKNVIVIQGVNGAGKSNLLNAITWCLYGIEAHSASPLTDLKELLNDKIRHEMLPGQQETVSVRIDTISGSGQEITFARTISFFVDANGVNNLEPDFQVYVKTGHDFVPHPEPNSEVNKILPQKVNSFFFFDGEKLDDFFKQNSATTVRDAVLDVSQISILDMTLDHLEETVSAARKKIKYTDPEAIQANERLLATEDLWRRQKNILKEAQKKIEEIDEKKQEFWTRANRQSSDIVKVHKREYDSVKSELKDLEHECEELQKEAIGLIISVGPSILLNTEVSRALQTMQTVLGQTGQVGLVEVPFIQSLLASGMCVCGRDLTEGLPKKKVEFLLEQASQKGTAGDLYLMRYLLSGIQDSVSSFSGAMDDKRKSISGLKTAIEQKKSELIELSTRLDNLVEDTVDSRFSFTQLDDEARRLEHDIALLETDLKQAESEYEKAKNRLNKAESKDKSNLKKQEKVKLGESVISLFGSIKERLVNETREILQSRTKDYFLSLIWKKETYVDVRIDENYTISVINSLGSDRLANLSAGERQVLALSFLAALREVSGFDAPILIDTPLGRISKKPKESIARLLPEFFGDSQVILLATDEEYSPNVRELLKPKVSEEYYLDYNEKEMKTEVKRLE